MLFPLPYHQLATEYFRQNSLVWSFFTDPTHQKEQLQDFKVNLLKSTYKFEETGHPELFQQLETAKAALGLTIPVHIYQAEAGGDMNASIIYLNEEAHIVFSGKLMDFLTSEELLALLGHELSHVLLYRQEEGDVEVVDRIISAIGTHPEATPAHYETARLFQLYTEIYCDRGASVVTKDYKPIISSLVKISTGLQTVNADSFIKQAEEVFANDALTKTSGLSHPENFIRARALALWQEKGAAAEPDIEKMIEGHAGIDELDLFKQLHVTGLTRKIIMAFIEDKQLKTPAVMALASQYFSRLDREKCLDLAATGQSIELLHQSLKEYLAYVLYDFVTADNELKDLAMGRGFQLAVDLRLQDAFSAAVKKEQKLTDKKVATLRKNAQKEYQAQLMSQA